MIRNLKLKGKKSKKNASNDAGTPSNKKSSSTGGSGFFGFKLSPRTRAKTEGAKSGTPKITPRNRGVAVAAVQSPGMEEGDGAGKVPKMGMRERFFGKKK